jgi:hypothetical protein
LIAKCVEPKLIHPEVEYDLLIDVMLDKEGLVDTRAAPLKRRPPRTRAAPLTVVVAAPGEYRRYL